MSLRTAYLRSAMAFCLLMPLLGSDRLWAKDELFERAENWKPFMLSVTGFNYTDQDIGNFSIDYAGGDMLGAFEWGGDVCCVSVSRGRPLPWSFHVRWAADFCEFTTEPNMYGETFDGYQHFYKETDVKFRGPVPKDPSFVAAHFYPDGHVDIDVTERPPKPRLRFDSRTGRPIRRCTAEELKQ